LFSVSSGLITNMFGITHRHSSRGVTLRGNARPDICHNVGVDLSSVDRERYCYTVKFVYNTPES